MGQRTLIGGTAYTIVGGKTMANSTVYNIKQGKTLINSTAYTIDFTPEPYLMIYNTGDAVFQYWNTKVDAGKTVVGQYTNFVNIYYSDTDGSPWNIHYKNIKTVNFRNYITTTTIASWFTNTNFSTLNTTNLSLNRITHAHFAFKDSKYSGPPLVLPNVVYLISTYSGCSYLTGQPQTSNAAQTMYGAYYNCVNLNGYPVCGPNVTQLAFTYYNCSKLTGSPVCGNKVTEMQHAYEYCSNITGNGVSGPNVVNMAQAYMGCTKLNGSPACGNKVQNFYSTFRHCTNLTGAPIIGPNVTNAALAYDECSKIKGAPSIGAKTTDMNFTYSNCSNLTGSPVTSENVVGMRYTYRGCTNLTGRPVIGNNVVLADFSYYSCPKLTQGPIIGAKVTNLFYAFQGSAYNMGGNCYIYSNVVNDIGWAFRRVGNEAHNAPRLNIYFHANTITHNTILGAKSQNSDTSITGQVLGLTSHANGAYNIWSRIWFYPVANVAAARAANGD